MNPSSFFKMEIQLSLSLRKKILFAMLAFYSLAAIVYVFGFGISKWVSGNDNVRHGDETLRYAENYAFGKGINPFEIMLGKRPQMEEEKVSSSGGTVPYNFVFYYLFHFSDSNKDVAMAVAFSFYVLALGASSVILFKFVTNRARGNIPLGLLIVFIFLGQFGVGSAFGMGNYSIYTYFFILLLVYTDFCQKRPIIGGICLGLGMMKPQTMMPFFVPLIFKNRFLTVSVSVVLVLLAYFVACFVLSMNPINLFKDFSEQGIRATDAGNLYCGVISSLGSFFFGGKPTNFLNISFIFFLIILFALSWKIGRIENIYAYIIPAAISTIWSYSYAYNSTGIYILWAVPIVLDFFAREKISIGRLLLYIGILGVMVFYLPRRILNLSTELFPFSQDLYRMFMVFTAFYIVIKRDTFITDYSKQIK